MSFDPRAFDPVSFDPVSFDPGSFDPMSVNRTYDNIFPIIDQIKVLGESCKSGVLLFYMEGT